MLRNYLTIALRNLRRNPGYTGVNMVGLAVGLACCLFIALYVQDEVSFDRFHANADRLVRLNKVVTPQEGGTERHAISSGLMGPAMVADFPEVEQAVRVLPWFDPVLTTHGPTTIKLADVVFVDANFFEVFDFDLLRGDPITALDAPASIVLTEATARRLFGEVDPVGQSVTGLNDLAYTVTGIVADPPANSHLPFNALISWSTTVPGTGPLSFHWMNNWLTQVNYTYLLLALDADPAALEAKLPAFMARHFAERADQYHLYLQPFLDLYLGSSDLLYTHGLRQSNRVYVYVFTAIAVLILLIACINFMNLATARAARRATEVGVRKAMGANRGQLARQFLGEALLTVALALVVALALMEAVRPAFNAFTDKHVALDVLSNPGWAAILSSLVLLIGFVAGAYPALVLSGFRPTRALKGGTLNAGGSALRKVLVTTQFAISIVLIAGTVIVYRQMQYMQTTDPGYRQEQLLVLPIDDTAIQPQFDAFKAALLDHPAITHAAGSSAVPAGDGAMGFQLLPEGKPADETWTAQSIRLDDYDLLHTYGMAMAAGRYFAPEHPTDSAHAVVINEALARALGWTPTEALGKRLDVVGEVDEGTVIGVIEDFHLESLRQAIAPLVLYVAPRWANLTLRITGDDVPGTLAFLQQTWEQFDQRYPFEYYFLDDAFARLYQSEQRLMQTLGLFAVLAIGIACLGLFGLAAYAAEQRTKEIGVRKVLGASVGGLVVLLARDFAWLVLVAFVVAAPVAYLAMQRWLDDFAYHIDISGGVFLLAGSLALVMALLTVSYQTLRAALTNPVKSLRYE